MYYLAAVVDSLMIVFERDDPLTLLFVPLNRLDLRLEERLPVQVELLADPLSVLHYLRREGIFFLKRDRFQAAHAAESIHLSPSLTREVNPENRTFAVDTGLLTGWHVNFHPGTLWPFWGRVVSLDTRAVASLAGREGSSVARELLLKASMSSARTSR
jgi:hypothetical protein